MEYRAPAELFSDHPGWIPREDAEDVRVGSPSTMKYLVVDSGPLIKGVRLERIEAEHYVTVPEVMLEIRDRQARQLLSTLPVELETREPSEEAIKAGANPASVPRMYPLPCDNMPMDAPWPHSH